VKKGLRELVEAAASLHPLRPGLHVYMVGEGPDRPLIEGAIQANNAASYIHALPGCAFDDVAVWMAASNLVTLPSYMEGYPNVVVEALASGRPVVATNVGGIPEILSDEYGCLVPPRDPSRLAQALASVLDRAWDAKAISAHGSRSWETVAENCSRSLNRSYPHARKRQYENASQGRHLAQPRVRGHRTHHRTGDRHTCRLVVGAGLRRSIERPTGDVLILLSAAGDDRGGISYSSYWRAREAIFAWQTGGFKKIVISGGGPGILNFLIVEGIPREAIVAEWRSTSTRENGIETARLIQGMPARRFCSPATFTCTGRFTYSASRALKSHPWLFRMCFTRPSTGTAASPPSRRCWSNPSRSSTMPCAVGFRS